MERVADLVARMGMMAHDTLPVNFDIKLPIFGYLSWRLHFSSFGLSRRFLSHWPRKRFSHQQSNSQKIGSLMSKFTHLPEWNLNLLERRWEKKRREREELLGSS